MTYHALSNEAAAGALTRLEVIILNISSDGVEFGHLGVRFKVKADDLLRIEPCCVGIPNPFGAGDPAIIFLRSDADVALAASYKACELLKSAPFAIFQPSLIRGIAIPHDADDLEAEREWLIAQGIGLAPKETMTTYTRTDCVRSTESKSNGVIDDQNSDTISNDDANPTD